MVTKLRKHSVKTYRVSATQLIGHFATSKEVTAAKKHMHSKSKNVKCGAAKKTKSGYVFPATATHRIKSEGTAAQLKAAVMQHMGNAAKVTVSCLQKKRKLNW